MINLNEFTKEVKLKTNQMVDDNGDPFTISVDYSTPKKDTNEMKKFILENIQYFQNGQNLIKNYKDAEELFQMIVNTQTEQIEKLNEITIKNQGIIKALLERKNKIEN
ncbi:MAG: hypothetical protein MJ252_03710, partial [archaeon]|nr:hypothetical protein [archaeon]